MKVSLWDTWEMVTYMFFFTFGVELPVYSDVVVDIQCDMCVIPTLFILH